METAQYGGQVNDIQGILLGVSFSARGKTREHFEDIPATIKEKERCKLV
jgi:hypothetical protein